MSKLNSIETLMDGYNPQRQLLEQTRQLVTKWEPTGLLEGMEDETKRHGMAVLLENQASQLIQEASLFQPGDPAAAACQQCAARRHVGGLSTRGLGGLRGL